MELFGEGLDWKKDHEWREDCSNRVLEYEYGRWLELNGMDYFCRGYR